ncbi:MAG: hypothetical protein ACKVS7_06860 [Gemmatimonadaceae bacterium]
MTTHSRRVRSLLVSSAIVATVGSISACSEIQDLDLGPDPLGADSAVLLEDFSGRSFLPADNWWNVDVSNAPVDPQSDSMIAFVSGRSVSQPNAVRRLTADFGPPPYGIPYVGVSAQEPLRAITFTQHGAESDSGAPASPRGYPIPRQARVHPGFIEGNVAGGGSIGGRKLILVDRDRNLLFETWSTRYNMNAERWEAGAGAVFLLDSNARRVEGHVSADNSGLAVFPGLVRYDEVSREAPITHAFRVTVRGSNGYVFPASRGINSISGAPPLGARLRLRVDVDISGFSPELRRIFQAMKTHGLIVADVGADLAVTGTMDPRWNRSVLTAAFQELTADDFEVIERGWQGGAPLLRAPR